MKLLVAVVMIVLVSIAFADDVTWKVAEPFSLTPRIDTKEVVPVPGSAVSGDTKGKVHAQSSQQSSQNSLTMPTVQPSTENCWNKRETFDDKEKEHLQLLREANCIQRQVIAGGKTAAGWQRGITALQILLAGIALYYSAKGVRIANRSLRVANRAYLGLGRWLLRGLKKDVSLKESGVLDIRYMLVNSGNTPAHLIAGWGEYGISKEIPPRPDYAQRLREGQGAMNVPLTGKEEFPQIIETDLIDSSRLKAIRDGTTFFYIYGCYVYEDVFKERHWAEFLVRYDRISNTTILVGGAGRNRST